MPLSTDLVGARSPAYEFAWDADDVMLYAVAVGAGQPDPVRELQLTTDNTPGSALVVLPTFANIITRGARVPMGDVDMTQLVHAEQAFTLSTPLPTSGRATVTAEIVEVLDKGSAAMVTSEATAVDAESGAPLATTRQTVFIRGAGGFGGPRGESARVEEPTGPPGHQVQLVTRPEQALLYRLTGDRNPLHTDPAFAAKGGFDRPILHGMCTYGFTGRALLDTVCGGDPDRFVGMQARFTAPVWPGDELTVSIWVDGDDVRFATTRGSDVVIGRGRLELR